MHVPWGFLRVFQEFAFVCVIFGVLGKAVVSTASPN